MATVYFDKEHSKIVEMFGDKDNGATKKIFSSNYEFMIFAAMIGRSLHDSCENVKIDGGMMIKDVTFGDKEDIAYLLALDGAKNGEIMRSGNENEIWKYLSKETILASQVDELHDIIENLELKNAELLEENIKLRKYIENINT